uniref:Uncharacterized protein n=1 Tax=Anguilla anguilla TaxID=7936 RepID=A0A0E9V4B3_ANGAN
MITNILVTQNKVKDLKNRLKTTYKAIKQAKYQMRQNIKVKKNKQYDI